MPTINKVLKNKWKELLAKVRNLWRKIGFRYFVAGFVCGILTVVFLASLCSISNVLFEIQSGERIQFFSSVGAAIMGVLAITFSLNVVAVQHASESGSTRSLRAFSNNKKVVLDYVSIASIASLMFIFSLFPEKISFISSGSFLFAILCIIFVFYRLFSIYKFILHFIDPVSQAKEIADITLVHLSQAREMLADLFFQRQAESGIEPTEQDRNVFISANFELNDIVQRYAQDIEEVVNLIRTYSEKKRYDVTAAGYRALIAISIGYFQIRKVSLASANIFVSESRSDRYLIIILEKLRILYNGGMKNTDVNVIQQNFETYGQIALATTQYDLIITDVANPNTDTTLGYFQQNILDAIRMNLDDPTLAGIRQMQQVVMLIPGKHFLTVESLFDKFYEQSVSAIAINGKWFLVSESVKGIVIGSKWAIENDPVDRSLDKSLKLLVKIAQQYVQANLYTGLDGGGLAYAIATTNEGSLPYILDALIIKRIKNGDLREDFVDSIVEYYGNLGLIALQKDHTLTHFVLSAIHHHLGSLIPLKKRVGKEKKAGVDKFAKALIRTYIRIFKALPENYDRNSFGHLDLEQIKELAMWSIKLKDETICKLLVDAIIQMADHSLKMTNDQYTAIRVFTDAVEIGAVAYAAEMRDIADSVIIAAEDFQKKYLEKYNVDIKSDIPHEQEFKKDLRETMSREIWRMLRSYGDYHPMRRPEIALESMIERSVLMRFLNKIEFRLYRRVTKNVHRRMF